MKNAIVAATALFIFAAAPALASEGSIGRTAFALPDSNAAQQVFKTDAPKIVLHVELLDVPNGTTVAADWIAEKTAVVPANYKIDSASLTSSGQKELEFSMSRPNTGWPAGSYRVDLSIDGEAAKSVNFTVAE